MWTIIGLAAYGVACFVAGALVYRNNATKANAALKEAQAKLEALKSATKASS